jgi:1-acyl-sn-glycerol-3-phosphate acyltransferase
MLRLEMSLLDTADTDHFEQAYTDWMYIWILGHLTGASSTNRGGERSHGSKDIIILLKKSLKWVPIVGWGM